MAILFMDSFATYTDLSTVGNRIYEVDPVNWTQTGTGSGHSTDGRILDMPVLGGRSLVSRFKSTNGQAIRREVPIAIGAGDTIGVSLNYFCDEYPTGSNQHYNCMLFGFLDAGQTDGIGVGLENPSNRLVLKAALSGTATVFGVSDIVPMNGIVYNFELKIYVHETEGFMELKVNGNTALLVENFDTTQFGYDDIALQPSSGSGSLNVEAHVSDLVVWDGSGDSNNDFLGPCRVRPVWPSEDVQPQDWQLSQGADAYALLDSLHPGMMDSYIEADQADQEARLGSAVQNSSTVAAG